ncbi:RNA polymerase sigma factor [Enhygromyxa salina]|uniref:RNA polymerase sigma factor n=1 Tax=Enhygromyxa salina TaxID=215803 RepID=UPI003B8A643E
MRHLEWTIVYARKLGAGDAAEDVAHNVLLSMLLRPPVDLRNASARPYMITVIRREIWRVRGRVPLTLITGESCLDDMSAGGTSPTEAAARRQVLRSALRVIAELPTPRRHALALRETKGLTYAEVAAITGRNPSSVQSSHRRTLAWLRRKLVHRLQHENDD